MPTDQTAQWRVVDDWWERASTTNTETITDLQALFEALNEQWRDSPASFDRDPLYAEWRDDGPLRTAQEENWSQWLAHLCDTAPPSSVSSTSTVDSTGTVAEIRCVRWRMKALLKTHNQRGGFRTYLPG